MSLAGIANVRPQPPHVPQPGAGRRPIDEPRTFVSPTGARQTVRREYIESADGEGIEVTSLGPMIKQVLKDQIIDEPDKIGARRLIVLDAFIRRFGRYVRNVAIGIVIVGCLGAWLMAPDLLARWVGMPNVSNGLAAGWFSAWFVLYFVAAAAAIETKISNR